MAEKARLFEERRSKLKGRVNGRGNAIMKPSNYKSKKKGKAQSLVLLLNPVQSYDGEEKTIQDMIRNEVSQSKKRRDRSKQRRDQSKQGSMIDNARAKCLGGYQTPVLLQPPKGPRTSCRTSRTDGGVDTVSTGRQLERRTGVSLRNCESRRCPGRTWTTHSSRQES